MKIVKDENNEEWEVYTLKKWSFVLLLPLAYNAIAFLLQAISVNVQEIPYGWAALGAVGFIIINADYLGMMRVGITAIIPTQGQITVKKTPFKIWVKKHPSGSPSDTQKM